MKSIYFYICLSQTIVGTDGLNTTFMFTKEQIQENIRTKDSWTIRTLEVLYNRQTLDEQNSKQTTHNNSRGFNGRDSHILTSFYEQVQKRKGYNNLQLLTEKQMIICRKLLPKYWRQVSEEIESKQGNKEGG